MRERGVRDHDSKWRVLQVIQRGDIGAVKLDVIYKGIRYIDYLLLLRITGGWKIAAAVWGDPAK
jgi:hypothetical protein